MKFLEVNYNELTNVIKQYYDIKKEHLDKIVLFQLGDFYEMFFEDAITISKLLGLTLTAKNAGQGKKIPMCGIPVVSLNEYIKKIINNGYFLAVVEQKNNASYEKLVTRSVTKIISPGTYIESQESDNSFVGSISYNKTYCLAYGDISTGELAYIISKNIEVIENEILNLGIKEIIYEDNVDFEFINRIKKYNIFSKKISEFNFSISNDYLYELIYEAQKNLIKYFNYTQVDKINHLGEFVEIKKISNMFLSNNTQTQLELVTSYSKEHTNTLFNAIDYTKTAMGKRLLKQVILHPLYDKDTIISRQNLVEKLVKNPIELEEIQELISNIYDFERLLGKINNRTINPREIENFKKSLYLLPKIKEILGNLNFNNKEFSFKKFDVLSDLYRLLDDMIVHDAPIVTKDGGFIKEGYSSEIDECRELKFNSNTWLMNFENQESQKNNIKNLKVKYNKIFGYFIEVTNSNIHLVPDYYIRKQTMTGCERYITDELKEEEIKILTAADKLQELELIELTKLKEKLIEFIPKIQNIAQLLSKVDLFSSYAISAINNNLIKPSFNNQNEIKIEEAEHIIVKKNIENYIKNDVMLDKLTNIQIITGPNMSGKSTYMRMIGIIVIMAQIGSYVPAKYCNIPIFDGIFTRIGANDNISQGQSTFMVEMLETKEAIDNATENSLIIFDELGRGTSTYDGIALAKSLLIYLSTMLRAKILFSTHYHELMKLNETYSNIDIVHVKAIEEAKKITFYHKVQPGGNENSYGIQVASLAGINNKIIKMAETEFLNLKKESIGKNEVIYKEIKKESNLEISLKEIDINNITPLEAFELLKNLKDEYE